MSVKICPKCGKVMVVRNGKYGKFYGCTGFPRCNGMESIKYAKIETIIKSVTSDFVPSIQQNKIYAFMALLPENLLVEAGPGCGKTSTMITGLKFIPQNKSVLFLSFARNSVKDIIEKLPVESKAAVMTLNSYGNKTVLKAYPKAKLDNFKLHGIIKTCGLIAEDDRKSYTSPLVNIIGKLQANLLPVNQDNINAMIEKYSIEINNDGRLIEIINYVINQAESILPVSYSYDDQINFSVRNPNLCQKYDVIICDEAQDLTLANLQLIKNICHTETKVIFVGDRFQSIYGFRGSNVNSIDDIKKMFSPKVLPLTVTRRIPTEIVRFLNEKFPHITLTSEKIGGKLDYIKTDKLTSDIVTKESAFVLCRYNAPLVKPCLSLIKQGIKAILRGHEFSDEITNLIVMIGKKYNAETIADLLSGLDSYYNDVCQKYSNAKNKNFIEVLSDKIDVINILASEVNSIDGIIVKLDEIFDDNKPAKYEFSSIHKAKGQENPTIYCLNDEKWFSKKAVTDEAIQQENNCLWVGYSRSKDTMIFVND